MNKLFYDDIFVTNLLFSNKSLNVEEILEIIEFDEEKFIEKYGFDEIDYNDFIIKI